MTGKILQTTPTVSIIIPVKNEEENIGLLLEALERQSYPFDEVVITDGGSTDRTRDVIESFSRRDKRIKLVSVKKANPGKGRNIAIKHSTGSVLAFIDSGIIPEPNWLEKLMKPMMNESSTDCVFGHVIFDTRSRIKPVSDLQKILVLLTKPNEEQDCFYLPGSAMKRSIWEELKGFPQESETGEDLVLIGLIKNGGYKYAYEKDAISYYYDYPDSMLDIFRKWVFHTQGTTTVFMSVKYFLIKLIVFLMAVVLTIVLALLSIKNLMLGLFLIVFLCMVTSYRLVKRANTHRPLSAELLRRPVNWVMLITLFFSLDIARVIGVFKGLSEHLRRHNNIAIARMDN